MGPKTNASERLPRSGARTPCTAGRQYSTAIDGPHHRLCHSRMYGCGRTAWLPLNNVSVHDVFRTVLYTCTCTVVCFPQHRSRQWALGFPSAPRLGLELARWRRLIADESPGVAVSRALVSYPYRVDSRLFWSDKNALTKPK